MVCTLSYGSSVMSDYRAFTLPPSKLGGALFCVLSLLANVASAEKGQLLYYDPDGNQQAIVSIAAAFNDYLTKRQIPLTFQPLQRRADLEAAVDKSPNSYFIVSALTLDRWKSRKIRVLLNQDSGGDIYFRKKLVDTATTPDAKFAAKTVALSMGENAADLAQRVLGDLRGIGMKTDGMIVIPVVKDVDALFALSFGQVQSALVTQASLEVMGRVNPVAAKRMRIVGETARILRAPLCAIGGGNAEVEAQLVTALVAMADDVEGRRAIKAMGFEKWVEPKRSSVQQ